jgi:hypothetical protein
MQELLKSLIDIQQRLNVPKNQYNQFGKFKYRSLEDIQAALKPLLAEHNCGIRFDDTIVEHCGRTFLKTTLTFFNDKGETLTTTSEAEHAIEKSGMDSAQISGAASSYARKYAMNALFLIDDSPEIDSDQYSQGRTTRKATTSTTKAVTRQAAPVDKNTAIKNAINASKDVNALLSLYMEHQQEVESNPEIKAMFTLRRQALQNQK